MFKRLDSAGLLDIALLVLAALLVILICIAMLLGTGTDSEDFEDFTIFFSPHYDPYIHLGYPGQEDSLPTSPGGSCSIEVRIKNVRNNQILSGIVIQAHDLVADTSAILYLNQALYVGPNVLLPKDEVSLGSLLIGLATRDQSLPYSLSFSYNITWETLNASGIYMGTYSKKDTPFTLTLPPAQKE